MHPWTELVKIALLGTERHGEPPHAQGALAPLITAAYGEERLKRGDQERALLDVLAATALYHHCGRQPIRAPKDPQPPAAQEVRPGIGATATRHLGLILQDEHLAPLLPEWLAHVSLAGKRVSPASLPALLQRGAEKKELRAAIPPVLGERGAWLARMNPEWSYALIDALAVTEDDTRWEESSMESRLLHLLHLRRRDPASVHPLLERVWKEEPAKHRAQFIGLFGVGLTIADEPFLEAALDDRSKEVRGQAAILLSMLPDSAFSRRLRERQDRVIEIVEKSGLSGKLNPGIERIDVTLPEELPPDWERDGIIEKPPGGKGKKAWWLEQILAHVPPGHFTVRWKQTPAALLSAAARGDWQKAFVEGWREATLRHRNAEWAELFLEHDPFQHAELWSSLTDERKESLFGNLIKRTPGESLGELFRHLHRIESAWSPDFSLLVIEACKRWAEEVPQISDYTVYPVLRSAALAISPTLCDEASRLLRTHLEGETSWTKILSELVEILRFRRDMLSAIAE